MTYRTKGTCAREIIFNVENGKLVDVKFLNGCSGNAQGLSRLVKNMDIDEVIAKLSGIKCRNNTSCPDQLAVALKAFKENESNTENAEKQD